MKTNDRSKENKAFIKNLIIQGLSKDEVIKYCFEQKQWTELYTSKYYELACQSFAEDGMKNELCYRSICEQQLRRYERLYRKAMADQDYNTASKAMKEIDEILYYRI